MKQLGFLFFFALMLVSCGTDGHHFKIDGRLIHLNQGEFYVYSPDGVIVGMDTIKVQGGRFAYEIACDKPGILMVVFPNFSEQPVFAEPGKEVSISGDASHLKEMEVEGTKENELMGEFRQQIVSASPPDILRYAEQFINDHPASLASVYLAYKYFMQTDRPDRSKIRTLLQTLLAAQPKNGMLVRMNKLADEVGVVQVGGRLPSFSCYDIYGRTVSSSSLSAAPVVVVHLWASWSFESVNMLQQLKQLQREKGNKFQLLAVSVDANRAECRRALSSDSLTIPMVCDGNMFNSEVVTKLGMGSVPGNLLLRNGKVVGQNLNIDDLRKKINEILP
ncbi:MAG TPA: DUF4369 domain-containing protein [Prevotella sp.]